MIAVGVLLVVCGGLSAAWLTVSAGGSETVLALAHDVPQGRELTAKDLVTVRITPDRALHAVPTTDRVAVIGRRASSRLLAGSLLTPGSTTTALVPGPGDSVVGISLTAAQIPALSLAAGDAVRVVSTPAAQADPPTKAPDAVVGTVVDAAAPDSSGRTTVDVLVPSLQAAGLAARAATGRVALVLDSRAS